MDPAAIPVLDLVAGGNTYRYLEKCKTVIDRKAQIDQLDLQCKQYRHPVLLVTQYMSRELAMHCRVIGREFIDTHGNAYLRGGGLLVFIAGEKKNVSLRQSLRSPKGLTTAGALRVTFALLSRPQLLTATFKDIATTSGVALGTAFNVLADLDGRGYLLIGTKTPRRMLEKNRLADEWVANFPTVLRTKLRTRRFICSDPHWWRDFGLNEFGAVWGSEIAAAKMGGDLLPATQTIYIDPRQMDNFMSSLAREVRIKPDPIGPIEILEKFWSFDIEAVPDCAPPLLVYSDLLSLVDPRARMAAAKIGERYLGLDAGPC